MPTNLFFHNTLNQKLFFQIDTMSTVGNRYSLDNHWIYQGVWVMLVCVTFLNIFSHIYFSEVVCTADCGDFPHYLFLLLWYHVSDFLCESGLQL